MFAVFLPAAAALAVAPPEQAAGTALMQCVDHAAGMGTISAQSADGLARNGLEYQAEAPERLRSMAVTAYGNGSFARSSSIEGDVWAIGYDRGTCIVMVLGTTPEPVEQRLSAMFAIPGTWKAESIKQLDTASRWTQYGWKANGRRLTAQIKVQPLPASPVKGLVMVTISPNIKK